MAGYYDYYIMKYPNMNKETIKDCLLCYLNEYSKRNEVRIENVNPFSVEIAKNVEQNVIVEIISIDKRNKEMNIKNKASVKNWPLRGKLRSNIKA